MRSRTIPTQTRSLYDLIAGYRSGEYSPVEEIARLTAGFENAYNSTVTTLFDRAEQEARSATERYRRGRARALEGVFFGVKDNIDVDGANTSGGSDAVPVEPAGADANVVARLRALGAIPIAKHNLYAYAMGDHFTNVFGTPRNPRDPVRSTGGSSSGSAAAVGVGEVYFALGTDTGGSIRMPSAWCGLAGLKPTSGSLPMQGIQPLAWTLDTVGPIARNVRDLRLVASSLFGEPSASDRRSVQVNPRERPRRVGIPRNWFYDDCDAEILRALDHTIEELTAHGYERVEVEVWGMDRLAEATRAILYSEIAAAHRKHEDYFDRYDPVFLSHIDRGMNVRAVDYVAAMHYRSRLQAALEEMFRDVDVVLTPTVGFTAPILGREMVADIDGLQVPWTSVVSRNLFLANVTGYPALSVNVARDTRGLPIGAQLLGPAGGDLELLETGMVIERVMS